MVGYAERMVGMRKIHTKIYLVNLKGGDGLGDLNFGNPTLGRAIKS
jgi:hypothetical protein